MELTGQTALVTGASRGLGRAIARRLAEQGAAVCVNYLSRADEAATLVEEIGGAGRAIALRADVGDPAQVEELVVRTNAELGPISILVNNAGLAYRATLETFDPAGMERMRRTNVDGLIHLTRTVIPSMKERRYGRIVNISSIAGHGTTLPGNAFYAATKAAVSMLTRRFAMELGPHGITVNAVAPGFILTDMVKQGRTEQEYSEIVKRISDVSMLGRPGELGRHCPRSSVLGLSTFGIHHRPDPHGGRRPNGLHRSPLMPTRPQPLNNHPTEIESLIRDRSASVCWSRHWIFKPGRRTVDRRLMQRERLITASEIGTYLFCRRARFLSRQGAPSSLEHKRLAGVDFHDVYSSQVRTAQKAGRLATRFVVVFAVLIVVALVFALR